jgi:hypothetical protein
MENKYTKEIYGYLGTLDETYHKDVPFEKFEKSVQDEKYAKDIYGWISSVDNSFSNEVPFDKFSTSLKKKVGTEPTQPPLGDGGAASASAVQSTESEGGLFAPLQYSEKVLKVKQSPQPTDALYEVTIGEETKQVNKEEILNSINNPKFVDALKNGEVSLNIQNDKDVMDLLEFNTKQFQPKEIEEPKEQDYQEIVDFYGRPELLPTTDRLKQAGNSFMKAMLQGAASVPKSVAILSKKLDFFDEYKGKETTDLATYKAGQFIDNIAKDLFPTSPEFQEEFVTTVLPSGAGSIASQILSAFVSPSAPLIVGSTSMGAPEFEQALQATGDEEKAFDTWKYNMAIGTTEAILPLQVFSKIDKATGGGVKKILREGFNGSLIEGAQEAGSQIASNYTAKQIYDANRDIMDGVVESAAAGAILGGFTNGVVASLQKKIDDPATSEKEKIELKATKKVVESQLSQVENKPATTVDSKIKEVEKDISKDEVPQDVKIVLEQERKSLQEQRVAELKSKDNEDFNNAIIEEAETTKTELESSLPNLSEASKPIVEKKIAETESLIQSLSKQKKDEPTTTVSEPIQEITAEPKPQVEEGVTETVSESVTEDSGRGAEATTTVLEQPISETETTESPLADVESTAKALEGKDILSLNEVKEVPKSSKGVSDMVSKMADKAFNTLETVLFNWADVELVMDGSVVKFKGYVGRDRQFSKGSEGGSQSVSKRDFLEWLFSDKPFDKKEYEQSEEWVSSINELRNSVGFYGNTAKEVAEAYHADKNAKVVTPLTKAVEQLLTPKTDTNAKEQQSREMREQIIQEQPQGESDSNMPIVNEAELQDREVVEEEVKPKAEPKEVAEEEKVEAKSFTQSEQLNKLFSDVKEKYGDKKGSGIYDAAIRLINPNQNEIVEIRSNGVIVKQDDKFTFKPFANTDANAKKWTLGKDMDITEQFVDTKEKFVDTKEKVELKNPIPTTVKKKNVKVDKSLSDILSGKLFSEVVRDNDLTDEQSIKLARALAESDNLPKKQFGKKDKIDNDFDPNDSIDVKPIEKPIKVGKSKIESIGATVSKDELRPVMQGVFKDSEKGRLVTTDAMKMVIINDPTIKKTEIVEPKTGKVIDGKYPNYDVVIPKDNPIKRKVKVKEWLAQLNGLAETKKFFDKTIAVKIIIGNQEFAFDSELMRDVFTVMAEQGITEVELQLSQPNRALVIESNKGVMGLVMPFMIGEGYRGGSKTLLETEMTIAEKNGVVQKEIDKLQERRKEKNNELKEAIQKFRNATAANAYSLEFDVDYHKKRLAEIDAEIAEEKSKLIDNPLQEKEDLQTVKTSIENGEITAEQATEYIAKPTKRTRKSKQSIEDIESKAESDNEVELNEAIKNSNELIEDKDKTIIDKLEALKLGKGQTGGLTLAPKLWNGFLDAIILGIKAGKAIESAIKDGLKFLKDNGVDNTKEYLDELALNEVESVSNAAKELLKPTETKEVKKTVQTKRAYEGKFREEVKAEIEKYGLTREIESQVVAEDNAKKFLNAVGNEAAFEAVKNGDIVGAEAASVLAQIMIDVETKAMLETDIEKATKLNEFQAELIDAMGKKALESGRFSSMLNRIYQTTDLGFSAEKKIEEYKALNDGVIPKEVEQKFRDLEKEFKEVSKKLAEAEQRAIQAEEKATIEAIKNAREREKATQKTYKQRAKKVADEFRKLKTKPPTFTDAKGNVIDITQLGIGWNELVEIGAKAIELSGDIADGVKAISDRLKSQEWYANLSIEDRKAILNQVEEYLKPKEVTEGNIQIPTSLLKDLVENGVDNIDDLVKAVKAEIQDQYPNATDRQIRDAITNYGKTSNLSQEEVDVKLRKMKRLGKLISQLEDIQEKKRPLRTGQQRDKLDAEERAKMKEVREAMKELPMDEETIERELKTALDATKSRLRNQIEDLQREIDKGEQVPKSVRTIKEDEELKSLREQRDKLKEESDAIFKNDEYRDAKRLEMAKKRTQATIDNLEKRLREQDFEKKKPKPLVADDELIKLRAEKLRIKEEFDKEFYKAQLRNRTKFQKWADAAWEIWNIPRVLMATGEFSFVGIQGLMQSVSNPMIAARSFKNAIEFFKSEKKTEDWLRRLKAQPYYPTMKESKLAITEPNAELTAREELFYSGWTNMFWDGIGKALLFPMKAQSQQAYDNAVDKWSKFNPLKATERAAIGYLDTLRVERFLNGMQMLEIQGKTFQDSPQDYKDVADAINTMTGRASLGKYGNQAAPLLSKLFFSPRNWASGIKTATPYALYHFGSMTPTARKMAIADFSKFLGLTTAMVAMVAAYVNNDDDEETSVEFDPRDTDFMKIKIGNTRIDPWGGKQQQVVLSARIMADAIMKGSYLVGQKSPIEGAMKKDGKLYPLGQPYKTKSPLGLIGQQAVNKLNPTASLLYNYQTTHYNSKGVLVNDYGKEYLLSEQVGDKFYPIFWGTVGELLKDDPNALNGLLAFYAFFGGGVIIYEDKEKDSTQQLEPTERVKSKEAGQREAGERNIGEREAKTRTIE